MSALQRARTEERPEPVIEHDHLHYSQRGNKYAKLTFKDQGQRERDRRANQIALGIISHEQVLWDRR